MRKLDMGHASEAAALLEGAAIFLRGGEIPAAMPKLAAKAESKKKRRAWTPAQRKAAAARMKAWHAARKAKK